jgi:hypothetical protein
MSLVLGIRVSPRRYNLYMAWENVEEKLKKALTVKVSFPAGTIWLPESHLSIDEWLTLIAETDEEIKELNIPRIRFLQNRWPVDQLMELEWDDAFSSRRLILAMYVGDRAYILFSDWTDYQVIAAIEPKNKPSLYRAVIGKLLENRSFVPRRPRHIRNRRPDLVPDLVMGGHPADDRGPVDFTPSHLTLRARWKSFLSDVLVGWIGKWLNLPELGFWHEELPDSISTRHKGEILMKYKQSYGDKQRDAQKRKKEEALQDKEAPPASGKNERADQPKTDDKRPRKEQKKAS